MKITFRLRISPYDMVRDAVRAGVSHGYYRAHKHTEAPSEDQIIEAIVNSVMGDLCETLDFDSAITDDADDERGKSEKLSI